MPAQREGGLSAFRRRAEQVLDAFNRGDFEAAWSGLPDDFEFHPIPDWPGAEVARGPREVIDYFRSELREMFPDWRGRIESISELAPGTYLNHLVMEGAGRAGGVPTRTDLFQVWDMDSERPIRVREFLRREEALAAARGTAPDKGAPER